MLTFILSILLTALISLCFYKKTFWENRFKILLIGSGVALIATLTVNYIVRPHLPEVTSIRSSNSMQALYVDVQSFDSLSTKFLKFNDFNITEYTYKSFDKSKTKTVVKKMSHVLLSRAIDKKDTTMYINYISNILGYPTKVRNACSDVHFAKSVDENAYIINLRVAKKTNSMWITEFSIPAKNVNYVIVLPAREYNLIPEKYKHDLPKYINTEIFKTLAQK